MYLTKGSTNRVLYLSPFFSVISLYMGWNTRTIGWEKPSEEYCILWSRLPPHPQVS